MALYTEPSTSRKKDSSSDDSSLNYQDSDSSDNFRSMFVVRPDLKHDPTSVDQKSSLKRSADIEPDVRSKRFFKSAPTDDLQPADPHRNAEEEGIYVASGLKNSLHGMVYQLEHLMLIVHRARKMDYSFRLATEMDIAEKFDDVILRYRDSDGDELYRFVQVKHKQDGTNAITATNLLDMDNGDFSLLKYFVSWRKIKKHPDFRGSKLKDFILCTNIGLEVNSLKVKEINISEVKEPDDFLTVTTSTTQPLRYKLLLEETCSLWDTLRSASDVHGLAKELAERVCGDKDIHLDTGLIKSYHIALAKEVVDVRAKQFSVNFIQNQSLSGKAAEFRENLFQHTKRLLSKEDLSEECIWELLEKSSLKLSSAFGKRNQSGTKPEQSQFTELPEGNVDDAEILSFLDEFIFAVNQPNEVELGRIIERDIGPEFNQLDASIVRDSFQTYILDWFKMKGGKFLTRKDADEFFDEMKGKLSSIKTMAVGLDHSEKLKNLGIQFNNQNPELQNFIQFSDGDSERLLEIISSEQTLLTALRVFQSLTEGQECENDEIFTVVRLETLSSEKMMDLVLRAFEWSADNNLLVIDCESYCAKKHSKTLWIRLSDIMAKNVQKKLIVITQEGKDLGTEWNLGRQTYRETNTDHSFRNLTNDSQKKLLGKQVTKFQERNSEISLGKLLGIDDCENLREDDLKDLSYIMDSNILVKLISGDEIQIGSNVKGLEEIERYYIHRTICRHVAIKKNILTDDRIPDLFAISGKNRVLTIKPLRVGQTSLLTRNPITDPVTQGDTGRQYSVQSGATSTLRHGIQRFTLLDSNREEEQFNALCTENEDRNVHWLQWKQDFRDGEKYVWKKTRGNITSLFRYRYATESNDNHDRTSTTDLNEVDLTSYGEPVIISDAAGTGKSTMLTYLASNIKKKDPNMLVLKIDLNNHATALEEVTKDSNYDLGSLNGAIRFLVRKLLSGETDLAQKIYERIIIRKQKLGLIFDGFDEISPDYENTVIDLLETLAKYGIKKLFVATRPHTRNTLESKLNAFSHEMKPFSTHDHQRFLTDYWKAKFEDSDGDSEQRTENRIQKYVTAIVKKLADSINDQDNKFTGNPLQGYLVAEAFGHHRGEARESFDSCKDFIDSEVDEPRFPKRIDLIYLYQRFVEMKFDVFFKRTGADPATIDGKRARKKFFKEFVDKHEHLALYALFGKNEIQELLLSQREWSHGLLETADADIVERDGIVTGFIDGQPQFGHRTYAEYFAAKFFTKMLKTYPQNKSLGKIFVADVLLSGDYRTLRAFMDWLLSNEHVDVLEGEFWPRYLKTIRSQLAETIFHVAAAEGNGHITLVNSGFVALDVRVVSSISIPTVHGTMDGFGRLALVLF